MALKEVKTISIEGVEYPFYIGINTTALYCELKGIDLAGYYEDLISMLNGKGSPAIIRDLIYCALKDGARREGKAFEHDNYWVGDVMDGFKPKDVEQIVLAITESLPNNKVEQEDEVDKKKVVEP